MARRSPVLLVLLVSLVSLIAVGSARAQGEVSVPPVSLAPFGALDALGEKSSCRRCGRTGHRACKRHGRDGLAVEAAVVHCSVATECRECAGALARDCAHCAVAAVEVALDERRRAHADWLAAQRARVDAHLDGDTVLHAQSAHVDLAFGIGPLTVGRAKLDGHRLMHLYLERLEALRSDVLEVFGLSDADFSTRLTVLMFADREHHRQLAPRVAGGGAEAVGMKQMGVEATYCMWHDRRLMPGDEELHRTVVHNVAHLLLGNQAPAMWLGNRGHGWIDEGVAHWFEDRLTGKCLTYCYEEIAFVPGPFKGGRWRVPVRQFVERRALRPFAVVVRKNTDELDAQDRAQAFAYVDFLIDHCGGRRLAALIRALKRKQPLHEALAETCGLKMLHFDEMFAEWVRAHYPVREERR